MPLKKRDHIGKGDSHYRIVTVSDINIGPSQDYTGVDILRGARLFGANLRNCGFVRGNFSETDFTDACFTESIFTEGRYYRTRFIGADLYKAQFLGIRAEYADFTEAHLVQAGAVGSNFTNAIFAGASMQGFDAKKCDFRGARFIGNTDLEGAVFQDVDFSGAIFQTCNLSKATFTRCDLSGVDLRTCDTTGIDITTSYGLPPRGGYEPRVGPPTRGEPRIHVSGNVAHLDPFDTYPDPRDRGGFGPPTRDYPSSRIFTGESYVEIPYGRRGPEGYYPHPAHLVRKYRP
jgi:uncharacterized protein YjbI with pentapeptide repeats